MRKILGITFGGLHQKTVRLVLLVLVLAIAMFAVVSMYQNRMLTQIVNEARDEQQQAVSDTSEELMREILDRSLVTMAALQADTADNDFAEVVNYICTLQTIAQDLFENRDSIAPAEVDPPDPAMDGTPTAQVLFEEGVDYTQSEYIGVAGHMAGPMLAMFTNSSKINSCYMGLADGTHLSIDSHTANRFDEDGNQIPYPVRERPWYTGAAETGGLYFTGMERDAFSGELCITCSAPVYAGGELVGVVGADIVLENMDGYVHAASDSEGFSFIVNGSGQVVLAPDGNTLFKVESADEAQDLRETGNEELAQFIDRALRERTELTAVAIDGRQYYMAGAPMPTIGWAVVIVVDKEFTEQPAAQMLGKLDEINNNASAVFNDGSSRIKRTVLLMVALCLLVGICAAVFAANRIVKPVEKMTRSIVESGRTGRPFEMTDSYRTHDEIEVLAESFDDLSKKTRKYIEDITRITEEKERISTELRMATRIQSAMLPHVFPPFPERTEFSLFAMMNPAKEVGGDFYDYFLIDEDHLCMVIADVSGKGVPAALFMMASKIILANNAKMGKSPAQIMADTNASICSNNQEQMFVTVWLGILEISTGRLTAANAGHEYPLLKKPDGGFELVRDTHSFVIGGMEEAKYREYSLVLEPGSKLFLYTDGVAEATNAREELFGMERVLQALNEAPELGPAETLEQVDRAVARFVGESPQFDDLTMFCLEYEGNGGTAGKA